MARRVAPAIRRLGKVVRGELQVLLAHFLLEFVLLEFVLLNTFS
jgi:hypothetical protein